MMLLYNPNRNRVNSWKLMEHLLADMKQVVGRIIILTTEMKHGLINPTQAYQYFVCNIDDLGWNLK
jgi:hypothetical protein